MQEYTIPFPQGQQFVNYQHQKTNEMLNKFKHMNNTNGLSFKDTYNTQQGIHKTSMSKNLTLIEGFGFDNTPVYNRNQSDISKVNNDINTLNTSQDTYKQSMNSLMDETQKYLSTHDTSSPYAGKNVEFSNGLQGYVTRSGVFKAYTDTKTRDNTAGKNGCGTSNFMKIDYAPGHAESGSLINSKPPMAVGPPMKSGQSCGYANKNVQVIQPNLPELVEPNYSGCYKPTSLTNVNELKGIATLDACKISAIDNSKSVVGLLNGKAGTSDCMIGDSIARAESGGMSTVPATSWTSAKAPNADLGGLLKSGQLGIAKYDNRYRWGNEPTLVKQLDASTSCHPAYGGYINTSNTTSNYGVNCI